MKNQFDKIIGGYTSCPWKRDGEFTYDSNAFLFSITLGMKFDLLCPNNAIFCYATNGPSFGRNLMCEEYNERCTCFTDNSYFDGYDINVSSKEFSGIGDIYGLSLIHI